MTDAEQSRFPEAAITAFVAEVFRAGGMDTEKAESTTRLLVLSDMMGRKTHGLAQADPYLQQLATGRMQGQGAPVVVRDLGGTVVWDGEYRPGLWLVEQALALCFDRIAEHGVMTVAIRRSHHIGCLAALAKLATDRGFFNHPRVVRAAQRDRSAAWRPPCR